MMGTRALAVFEDDGQEIAVIYKHWDGYPDGWGAELAAFLATRQVTNGISGDAARLANGIGCLAAQVVAAFKKPEAGDVYLHAPGTCDIGEEFVYRVTHKDGVPWLTVHEACMTAFGCAGTKRADMPIIYDGAAKDFTVEACKRPATPPAATALEAG